MKQGILIFSLVMLLMGCQSREHKETNRVVNLTLSSDGRYILSCHLNHDLVLWDTHSKRAKLIAQNVNPLSPYMLRNHTVFIWQFLDRNIIYSQFLYQMKKPLLNPGFQVYGNVLSQDKKHYFASDKNFAIYHMVSKRKRMIKPADNRPGYMDAGKWLDLTLSVDEHLLLTSAIGNSQDDRTLQKNQNSELLEDKGEQVKYSNWSGVMLWDGRSGKALHQLGGNSYKTHAVFSPNGEYVVAGDENSHVFIWRTEDGKRVKELDSLFLGKRLPLCEDNTYCHWRNKGLLKPPADFCDLRVKDQCIHHERVNVIRYISKNDYLRFTEGVRYSILYHDVNTQPKGYLYLKGSSPDVYGFNGGLRTDSAPLAHRLVMADSSSEGILLYQYDEETHDLSLVWAPSNYHVLING